MGLVYGNLKSGEMEFEMADEIKNVDVVEEGTDSTVENTGENIEKKFTQQELDRVVDECVSIQHGVDV